ncbi:MAG: DAK2 domain-containing protein [Actinomycetes bacterium]
MGESFDTSTVRDWSQAAFAGFGEARAEIDALNVFPVPDGDTGTNMFLTAESAAEAVSDVLAGAGPQAQPPLFEVINAFALGALLGARGNSGVIMSQILRGVSDVVCAADDRPVQGQELADALTRAADLAYQAVAAPKEGTILSVARAAELAAQQSASEAGSLADVAGAAAAAAQVALDKTPEQLEVLRDAGVVDSGGRGLVVLLDALAEAVTGVHHRSIAYKGAVTASASIESHTVTYGGPAYEVMYLLDGDDELVPPMRTQLAGLGDSLVVVGGNGLWNVHVHVDDIGAAIEAGIAAGRPYRIKVTHLEEAEGLRKSGRGDGETLDSERSGRALVAISHGPGVTTLLAEEGVTVVPAVPGRRPSTAELLGGILRSGGQEVIVLPSDKDTRAVAEAAAAQARDQGIRVAVVPTRSIVQTLAAVAVHQPTAHFDDDLVAMGRESGAARYGAVTTASRDSLTSAGQCRIGDVLGLVDGEIVEIGDSIAATAVRVLTRMLASGGELVTIIAGEQADPELINSVVGAAEEGREVEVEVIDGQQPLWPLIMGVE